MKTGEATIQVQVSVYWAEFLVSINFTSIDEKECEKQSLSFRLSLRKNGIWSKTRKLNQ